MLAALQGKAGVEPTEAIELPLDRLIARLQAIRFDEEDAQHRKRLQRVVERLRRVRRDLSDLVS